VGVASCLVVEFPDVAFVDATVSKASLVGALVQNHCVFHVIACVRNNCNDGIRSLWTLTKIIFGVVVRAHQRSLRE
jgi:hypothetical protein